MKEKKLTSHEKELVMLLPRKLQQRLNDCAAYCKAFEVGLLCVENGVVEYHLESKSELAFFCGRVFSNDKSRKVANHKMWEKGNSKFPGTELNEFFRVTNLRQLRQNCLNNKIYSGFKKVDNLFVMLERERICKLL